MVKQYKAHRTTTCSIYIITIVIEQHQVYLLRQFHQICAVKNQHTRHFLGPNQLLQKNSLHYALHTTKDYLNHICFIHNDQLIIHDYHQRRILNPVVTTPTRKFRAKSRRLTTYSSPTAGPATLGTPGPAASPQNRRHRQRRWRQPRIRGVPSFQSNETSDTQ
jgi:hypothetical protein